MLYAGYNISSEAHIGAPCLTLLYVAKKKEKINYCLSQCSFVGRRELACCQAMSREDPPPHNLGYESVTSRCTSMFVIRLCLS